MTWVAVAIGGSAIVGGVVSSNASDDANDAAGAASDAMIGESRRQFDLTRADTRVARETGNDALLQLGLLMGLRQAPSDESISKIEEQIAQQQALLDRSLDAGPNAGSSGPQVGGRTLPGRYGNMGQQAGGAVAAQAADTAAIKDKLNSLKGKLDQAKKMQRMGGDMEEFIKRQPGYEFGLKQGTTAVTNNLAAGGQGQGGKAMKALMRYGQDYAGTKTDEHLSRLFTLAGFGPAGANTSAAAGQNLSNTTNAAAGMRADAVGNAAYQRAGAFNTVANTGMSLWTYNNMMNRTPPPNMSTGQNLMVSPQGSVPPNVAGMS